MVFQQFNLFPHKTVLDNILLGPVKVKEMDRDKARTAATELLDRVGIPEKSTPIPQTCREVSSNASLSLGL